MQHLSLEFEHDYKLFGIHTTEDDYRLAFILNQRLCCCFSRYKESLNFDREDATFSIFEYKDTTMYANQYLIANKYVSAVKESSIQSSLFNDSMSMTSYLIPEKKNIDYFLKIEGDVPVNYLKKLVLNIKKIPQIITCYGIEPQQLKSKNALIF